MKDPTEVEEEEEAQEEMMGIEVIDREEEKVQRDMRD